MSDGKAIFAACCQEVRHTDIGDKAGWITVLSNGADELVVRAVIQTIIDLTPSPRTVDELTYILKQADAA